MSARVPTDCRRNAAAINLSTSVIKLTSRQPVDPTPITASEVTVAHDTTDPDRLRLPLTSKSFEVKGFSLPESGLVTFDALKTAYDSATEVPYTDDNAPPPDTVEKRLLGHTRVRYYTDDLSGMLTEGQVGIRALPYDTLTRALDEAQFNAVFDSPTTPPTLSMMQTEGGYVYEAGQTTGTGSLWLTSGRAVFDATKFYIATSFIDPFGNTYSTTFDTHVLLPVSATDPLSNTVAVQNDYRLLTPWELTDPNGNRSQVAFDTRGVVIKSAVMGKVGDSDGDTLADPTTTFEYDLFAFRDAGKPTHTKSRARVTHGDPNTEWIESYSYFGGAGQTLMVKAQAEPGLAPQRDQNGELVLDQNGDPVLVDTSPNLRWIGNGRTILDNKGNPVRQYEPYYSSTHEYEDEAELVEQGVSPLIHYDPIGRVIRTDFPDGTFSKAEFTPWESTSFDANDTVEDSDWYAARYDYIGGDVYWQKERRAAELAYAHRNTPSKMIFDSLGRPFLGIEDLGGGTTYTTRVVLDIRGLPSQIIDARLNVAEGRTHGILGQVLETTSVDAGDRQALTTILGEPLRAWDAKDQCARVTYDELRRPVDSYVQPAVGSEILLSRVIYGESLASPQTTNHRGRVYRTYGGGGEATTPAFDFKGLPTSSELKLPLDPTAKNDWTSIAAQTTIAAMATAAASSLETTVYTSSSTHDALGRVLTAISPDGSEVAYAYNERGALKTVDCKHRGSSTATPVVANIEYDVRGRRESITYASNATTTTYGYDPQNFRLQSIETTRASDSKKLQGLHYHYDPVGNVTDIRDDAQQTVYFQNSIVDAANSYEYDALYRLVEATGREHATQGTAQRSAAQLPPDSSPIPMANDPNALRRYTQRYTYDSVGNLETVVHSPSGGTGWTRRYQYRTDGNRLVGTSAPGDTPGALYTNTATYSHTYPHDVHGNFTSMPHMAAMDWDELDQLHHCTVGSQDVYFQYAGGQRIRKYVEHSGGTTEERIYLGPFELYRKHVSGTLKEEWESLHISDDTGRVVLVETHTVDDGNVVGSPAGIWRFQLSNHLGSAATEVTETGAVISYEEYHPYGTSAYRLVDSQTDVPAKRYRYTGMERDEETGLGYHTARYYVPWLGRWTAADPTGIGDGVNRFAYVMGRPILLGDTTGANGEIPIEGGYINADGDTVYSFEDENVDGQAYGGGDAGSGGKLEASENTTDDPLTDDEINAWATPEREQAFIETALADYEQHLRSADEQNRAAYERVVNAPANIFGMHPVGRYDAIFDPIYPGNSCGDDLIESLRGKMAVIRGEYALATPAERIRRYHAAYVDAVAAIPQPLIEQAVAAEGAAVAFGAGVSVGVAFRRALPPGPPPPKALTPGPPPPKALAPGPPPPKALPPSRIQAGDPVPDTQVVTRMARPNSKGKIKPGEFKPSNKDLKAETWGEDNQRGLCEHYRVRPEPRGTAF